MEKRTLTKADTLLVTTEEARAWLRIDDDQDEELLVSLILAAIDAAEGETNRSLAAAEVEYSFSCADRYGRALGTQLALSLPTAPVRGVTKVETEDCEGSRTELDAGYYFLRINDLEAVVILNAAVASTDLVIVTCVVGYETAAEVPRAIRQAIALHVGDNYANREGQLVGSPAFCNLLTPYRVGLL